MVERILLQSCRHELIEKGSKFIGLGFPCRSVDEFKHRKSTLEIEFPDATHITHAFKIKDKGQVIQRFSDAGEPAGTAGKPILMHIEGRSLCNVAIFVVRYFGGIKLGAGGLVRAYGNTAKKLLESAAISDYVPMTCLELELPYSSQTQLEYLLKKWQAQPSTMHYGAKVQCSVTLPTANSNDFLQELDADIQCLHSLNLEL